MQGYIIPVQEVVLEMYRHDLSVLGDICCHWNNLPIATVDLSAVRPLSVTLVGLVLLLVLLLLMMLLLFF
jgi:hypothetical protein